MRTRRSITLPETTSAQRYLNHFFENLTRSTDNMQVYGIFMEALDAYREAIRCFYYAQAYEATTVMCRGAIDGCFLLAIARVPQTRGRYEIVERPDDWRTLKREASKLLSLSARDIEEIERLRESGHFSAHIVARVEKSFPKLFKSLEEVQKFNRNPPKMHTTKAMAKKVLNRTGRWLTRLMHNYFIVYVSELNKYSQDS